MHRLDGKEATAKALYAREFALIHSVEVLRCTVVDGIGGNRALLCSKFIIRFLREHARLDEDGARRVGASQVEKMGTENETEADGVVRISFQGCSTRGTTIFKQYC